MLSSSTSSRFKVTLQESDAGAAFENSLGVYEVRSDGRIADVRLLTENVKLGGTFLVENIDDGSTLGFFIVQDGARLTSASALDVAGVGIDVLGGTAMLTQGGDIVDGATLFLSHDASLNVDGAQHALSGVKIGASVSLQIGFEDQIRDEVSSDEDFQDVVFTVEALPPMDIIAG
jgi:hypothetical protein